VRIYGVPGFPDSKRCAIADGGDEAGRARRPPSGIRKGATPGVGQTNIKMGPAVGWVWRRPAPSRRGSSGHTGQGYLGLDLYHPKGCCSTTIVADRQTLVSEGRYAHLETKKTKKKSLLHSRVEQKARKILRVGFSRRTREEKDPSS